MIANGLWLLVFIAAGVVTGVLVTRRARFKQQGQLSLNEQYFAGLNFVLNEEPDKALEVFLRMVEVDNETVETHLALGSLYRRRGEVDRAIRIHENIMARQSLKDEHREHAMFALGEDYFRAGLLDRAEYMFQRLTERTGWRTTALRYLLRIYEQQSDWQQAIAAFRQLKELASPEHPTAIAHYLCELATQARQRGEHDVALDLLRQVREEQRNFARSALLRAELAFDADNAELAGRLCQRVVELHPQLLPLVLQRFASKANTSSGALLLQSVRPLVRADSTVRAMYAYSGLTSGLEHEPFVLQCLADFVREDPSLNELVRALAKDPMELNQAELRALASALAQILKRGQRYRCVDCGLGTTAHFWQCPGCRSWDVLAPLMRVELAPVARMR